MNFRSGGGGSFIILNYLKKPSFFKQKSLGLMR